MPPTSHQLRLAHALETSGVADVADAAATLAVTLDRTLEAEALAAARAAMAGLEAGEGARRVVSVVRQLARGELAAVAGLPLGFERLAAPEPKRDVEPTAPAPRKDELDQKVDEELAALRQKLGL